MDQNITPESAESQYRKKVRYQSDSFSDPADDDPAALDQLQSDEPCQ